MSVRLRLIRIISTESFLITNKGRLVIKIYLFSSTIIKHSSQPEPRNNEAHCLRALSNKWSCFYPPKKGHAVTAQVLHSSSISINVCFICTTQACRFPPSQSARTPSDAGFSFMKTFPNVDGLIPANIQKLIRNKGEHKVYQV